MFGVDISTVAGRLRIVFFCGVGCQTSHTASQTSTAYSISVPVKLSGEYWYITSVPRMSAASFLISLAPVTAMSVMPSRPSPKTTRRCSSEVEL